jgi:hypothetical protein
MLRDAGVRQHNDLEAVLERQQNLAVVLERVQLQQASAAKAVEAILCTSVDRLDDLQGRQQYSRKPNRGQDGQDTPPQTLRLRPDHSAMLTEPKVR